MTETSTSSTPPDAVRTSTDGADKPSDRKAFFDLIDIPVVMLALLLFLVMAMLGSRVLWAEAARGRAVASGTLRVTIDVGRF